jgi:hypothetical protein
MTHQALEGLLKPSENHVVRTHSDSIEFAAVASDQPALSRFQPVADAVLEIAAREGLRILRAHKTDRFPGNLYDHIIVLTEA